MIKTQESNVVDSSVNYISFYGGPVFRFDQHKGPQKVQLCAARAFLFVPRNAVKCAMLSEIDWLLPKIKQESE